MPPTERKDKAQNPTPSFQSVLGAVNQFLASETWDEAQDVATRSRSELFSDSARIVLDGFVRSQREDEEAVFNIEYDRELLRRASDQGVEGAFAPYVQFAGAPRISMARLAKMLKIDSVVALADLIQKDPQILNVVLQGIMMGQPSGTSRQPALHPRIQQLLQEIHDLEITKGGSDVQRLVELYREGAALVDVRSHPESWIVFQDGCARSLVKWGGEARIEEALTVYERIFKVLRRRGWPTLIYLSMHQNRGSAYRRRIAGSRRENLDHAVHEYEAAFAMSDSPDIAPEIRENIKRALRQMYLERSK